MATQVQFRGGTTTEHASFNGVAKEVTVDTTKQTLVVQDGSTNGGYMGLRFFDSSNTIITASEYDWAGQEMKSYASFDNTWYAQNNDQIAPILVGTNDDHRGGGALIRVFNADDTSSYTFITAKSSTYMDSGGEGSQSIGVHKVTEKITGVRLDPQSVDMSLSATVYGVK